MATSFPTSLQDLDATRGTAGQPLSSPSHVTHHTLEDDTIEALQAKVGADSSAVTSSHDYKLSNVTGSNKAVSAARTITATAPITIDGTTSADLSANRTIAVSAASSSAAGVSELAIASEVDTGTDTARSITPDALAGSNLGESKVSIMVTDPGGDALTTGDSKAYFRVPSSMTGMDLVEVEACLSTVSSSGAVTVMVHRSRRSNATSRTLVDMLSTAITLDQSEFDTVDAATPNVINTSNDDVVTGDQIHIDIDGAGTGAKGLVVTLVFRLP